MSAHCNECGTDLVYPAGTWPLGECAVCRRDEVLRDILDITTGWSGLSGMEAHEKLEAIDKLARSVVSEARLSGAEARQHKDEG